jgi:hypothetical protein
MLFTKNFLAVSRIAESIFEGLPSDEAPAFFAAFSAAIECNGKDLSRVVWQFLAAELRSLPPGTPEVQAAIDTVIDGIDLLAQGKEWSEGDAEAAASAAQAAGWAAARTADWAAADAGRAANWAGWAAASAADRAAQAAGWSTARAAAEATADAGWATARAAAEAAADAGWAAAEAAAEAARVATRRRQRDLLLKLIQEAPVTQQQQQQDNS